LEPPDPVLEAEVRTRLDQVEKALRKAVRVTGFARGDAVILWTGWEARRGRDIYLFENPGLDRRGAEELVRWGTSLVGVDTANIDHPEAGEFPAHHSLLKARVPIIENVANLADVRASTFTLVALPLRLRGATGSPIRAVALV
jgi:kynurenine formamidase